MIALRIDEVRAGLVLNLAVIQKIKGETRLYQNGGSTLSATTHYLPKPRKNLTEL